MARRNRDLAGLAALGALGYAMFGGKDGTRDRDTTAVGYDPEAFPAPAAAQGVDPFLAGELARASRASEGVGLGRAPERQLNRSMAAAPARRMDRDTTAVGYDTEAFPAPRRRNVQGDYTRKMGATAEEIAAYNRIKSLEREPAYVSKRKPNVIYDAQGREVRSLDTRPDLSTAEGRARAAEEQALEGVYPEQALGGVGMRGLHTLAKGLANRSPRQLLLPAPAARPPIKGAGEGFVMYKKGGAVKAKPKKMASGGSTSSASKRADGIATKGKTKCKMY